jgi:hypothetical protein
MDSMENFFNYLSKPVPHGDVDIWFKSNNIIFEKMELYYDFIISLFELIENTFLGESSSQSTKIELSEEDNIKHFDWCWNKTIEGFSKENVLFNLDGDHYEYLKTLFLEIFYNQNENTIRNGIKSFFKELFDLDKEFTRSDLDMISSIYKSLDRNMLYNVY